MRDSGLVELYRVETRALLQAAKRNPARFPGDFVFQFAKEDAGALGSVVKVR
jgi:hypothetical protein